MDPQHTLDEIALVAEAVNTAMPGATIDARLGEGMRRMNGRCDPQMMLKALTGSTGRIR